MRDYGLPNSEVIGRPVAKLREPNGVFDAIVACPNCGCEELMEVTVSAKQSLLKGGEGKGTYLGCPACPFASPMLMVSNQVSEGQDGG